MEKGDFREAIDDLDESLKLAPKHADTQAALALIYASSPDDKYRDGKKAVEFGKKAVDQAPKDYWVREALAAAYAEAGDFDKAVAEQQKVLDDMSLTEVQRSTAESRMDLYKEKKPYRLEIEDMP